MPVECRRGVWGVRLQIDGKQIRKSLGKGSIKADAVALEHQIRRDAIVRGLMREPPSPPMPEKKKRGPGGLAKDPTKRHHLYRHFDAEGRLLYVGISMDGFRRMLQHNSTAEWRDQITTMTIERYPHRAAVLEAEARAIIAEKPLHNVTTPTLVATGKRITDAATYPPKG